MVAVDGPLPSSVQFQALAVSDVESFTNHYRGEMEAQAGFYLEDDCSDRAFAGPKLNKPVLGRKVRSLLDFVLDRQEVMPIRHVAEARITAGPTYGSPAGHSERRHSPWDASLCFPTTLEPTEEANRR